MMKKLCTLSGAAFPDISFERHWFALRCTLELRAQGSGLFKGFKGLHSIGFSALSPKRYPHL